MSVDTNTKGKNLAPYRRVRHNGVDFLVAPTLHKWAADVNVDVRRALTGVQRFRITAGHKHAPT